MNNFRYGWVGSADEPTWRVWDESGRLLGTVAETGDGYEASTRLARGALRTRRFGGREAAARWLADVAGPD